MLHSDINITTAPYKYKTLLRVSVYTSNKSPHETGMKMLSVAAKMGNDSEKHSIKRERHSYPKQMFNGVMIIYSARVLSL